MFMHRRGARGVHRKPRNSKHCFLAGIQICFLYK